MDAVAHGPVLSLDLKQRGKEAGISWATLRRAGDSLGVVRGRVPGYERGPWAWWLPGRVAQPAVSNSGIVIDLTARRGKAAKGKTSRKSGDR
jgi:hypothetical protein